MKVILTILVAFFALATTVEGIQLYVLPHQAAHRSVSLETAAGTRSHRSRTLTIFSLHRKHALSQLMSKKVIRSSSITSCRLPMCRWVQTPAAIWNGLSGSISICPAVAVSACSASTTNTRTYLETVMNGDRFPYRSNCPRERWSQYAAQPCQARSAPSQARGVTS